MIRRNHAIAAITACALSFGASKAFAGVSTYDFSAVDGSVTPLTIGLATFSSPSDPGAFTFGPNGGIFPDLGSEVLSSAGYGQELDITFSAPQDTISFDFGLNGALTDTLNVAINGGTPTPETPSDWAFYPFYSEGTVSLTSLTPITSIELTSNDPFVIADLTTVPEPASLTLLGVGLAGLAGLRRRRA